MAKQLFINNFSANFVGAVVSSPSTASPQSEVGYGVLRISAQAGSVLINPSNGDYYVLTAYKKSGNSEVGIEVLKVTEIDSSNPAWCSITVQRAQEGTAAQSYAVGDHLSLRLTKGAAERFLQDEDIVKAKKKDVRIISSNGDAVLYASHLITGGYTLKLPASTESGHWVEIMSDGSGFPVVDGNGKPIMGKNESLKIDKPNVPFRMTFIDNTRGWMLF